MQLELHPFLTASHVEKFPRNWFQNEHMQVSSQVKYDTRQDINNNRQCTLFKKNRNLFKTCEQIAKTDSKIICIDYLFV